MVAGVLTWGVVSAVRPPVLPTAQVVVARHDLVPGTELRTDDLALEARPSSGLAVDSVPDPGSLVGRTVAFPVHAGEVLTARHVVGSALLEGLGAGLVATPVTLADPSSAALVSIGDVVDVLAATTGSAGSGAASASVVATRVRVLVAPVTAAGSSGGLLAAPASDGRSASALVLATTTEQALAIARAAVGSRLSLTLRAN